MASCSSLLSEDQVLCSICLEVFNEPVSIACGHNFCKLCISNYWDTTAMCQCPLCKDTLHRRPELRINTAFRDFVENVQKMKVRDEEEKSLAGPGDVPCDVCTGTKLKALKSCLGCLTSYCETHLEPHLRVTALKKHKLINPVENLEDRMCKFPAGPGDVPCDVCVGTKLKALNSCLGCLTSYCETHLEPHLRVAALKKHKLIHPVGNLEDRMCKKHDRLIEFFCRKEQACVCVMCMNTHHKTHNTVPLEEECGQRKTELRRLMADIDQMMKTRRVKVREIKLSVETGKRDAVREISESAEVFAALVRSIERSQAELIQVIEERQKGAEKQAGCFIRDLEQEIAELKRRSSEIETLSHSEDHLQFIQTFPSLSTPPPTKDWSQISVQCDLSAVRTVRTALSPLRDTLNATMEKVKLKRIQQYAVTVTLDANTAHPKLVLSADGKQVRYGDIRKNLPDNPGRFDRHVCVLGKQSFSSGRFYYEVQVEGKTEWDVGVARESINTKGYMITLSPQNGFWSIRLRHGDEYMAAVDPGVVLSLKEKPQKVGVFVDYEEGQVSFYNVEAKSHIYSFTGCAFTGKLSPFFHPGLNVDAKNSAPLIITPVPYTA